MERVDIGTFNIVKWDDGTVWVGRHGGENDGEGMEVNEGVFSDWIGRFYYENF